MTAAKPHSPADDLKSHKRKENADGGQRTLAPAGDIRHRDEAWWKWWNRDRLMIAAKNAREFQQFLHVCLRAAPNWAQVERLRAALSAQIEQLDRATREDVLAAITKREKELRGDG